MGMDKCKIHAWQCKGQARSVASAVSPCLAMSARSPFWLRMFLQESAIALHLYQMPNLRSPFCNKSKSAIAQNSQVLFLNEQPDE